MGANLSIVDKHYQILAYTNFKKGSDVVLNCLIYPFYRLNVQDTGVLEVTVTDDNNRPLPNALVKITKLSYIGMYNESAEGVIIAELYTDTNGKIHIDLPVLHELMNGKDYYAAGIVKEGYYESFIYYIQIYPNIKTLFHVNLAQRIKGQPERVRLFFQPKKETFHKH